MKNWKPPEQWQTITTIDAHTEGEPFRIITSGLPDIPGETILEKRQYAMKNLDHIRKLLIWEPRGHADMYGCIITPPVTNNADFGVLFMHNEGFSTMCGHGIIGVTTVAVETGFVKTKATDPVIRIDSPAGLVTATAHLSDTRAVGRVGSVSFDNVASFAPDLDNDVMVPDIGKIRYDLGFGGAFYAFVKARDVGLKCSADYFPELVKKGMAIKRAIMASRGIEHPVEADLGFLYGVIFTEPAPEAGVHSRHVCVFAEGEVDRSPTGTGVSARLAILHKRGDIAIDQEISIKSIINSSFTGIVVGTARLGSFGAVIPRVTGTAHITGVHRFVVDPDDPLKQGFVLR